MTYLSKIYLARNNHGKYLHVQKLHVNSSVTIFLNKRIIFKLRELNGVLKTYIGPYYQIIL